MALDSNRILNAYKSKGYELTTDAESAMLDLIECIIDEITTNADVSVDVVISNPSGLTTTIGPVTGSTSPNMNTSTGGIS